MREIKLGHERFAMVRTLLFRRAVWVAVIAAVVASASVPGLLHAWRGNTGDFTHFWRASQAMLHRDDIYHATQGRYVYPPLLAFALQPLAILREPIAAIAWLVCSISILLIALFIVSGQLVQRCKVDLRLTTAIVAGALILNFDKVRALFNLGQTDAIILLGFAAALLVDRKPILAGIGIGVAANVKYLSLIFLPYFLITRRFRAAATTLISFAFFLLLPAIQVGLARDLAYVKTAFAGVTRMFGTRSTGAGADVFDVAWNRSVSVTSTVFRFTRAHSLGDQVAVIAVAVIFIAVVAVLVAVRRGPASYGGVPEERQARRMWAESGSPRRVRSVADETPDFQRAHDRYLALDWTCLVLLALLFSPQTTIRHFVLATLVYEVVIVLLFVIKRPRDRRILIGATAILLAGLTLPFGTRTSEAVWRWREMGGPSWCAMLFLFVLNWAGRRADKERQFLDCP